MEERQQQILAWIGRRAVAGTLPSDEAELARLLREAGFPSEAIAAALGDVVGVDSRDDREGDEERRLGVAQLSEQATRFLNVLRNLGYLDDSLEDEVLDLLMVEVAEREAGEPPRNIELDDLRQHVATVLFDRQHELAPETLRLLEEEWRVVFH